MHSILTSTEKKQVNNSWFMIEFFESLNLSNTMIRSLKRYIGQTILGFVQITDQR